MRILFLIPDLRQGVRPDLRAWLARRGLGKRFENAPGLWANQVFGGVLNMMRQCALARSLGADAVLATESGTDTYGRLGVATVPFVAWRDRRHDDVCVIPDVYSRLADDVQGDAIVYEQHPLLIRADFDHLRPNVRLWTCSPLMVERCGALLPGKEPAFVPNIVDPVSFPFVEQHRRRAGRLAALPRKGGMAFIRAAYGRYRAKGGRYWQLDLIDRLPFTEFAARYREPQAFLPATDVEGCGLPAMEAMAAGIAVAGKNGGGASFYMRDGETALVANGVEEAADALLAIENAELRSHLSQAAYESIRDFFPEAAPTRFWRDFLAGIR
jgi:hypothetical protein